MKGLLKMLSPFAPDQSGAESVLYELGGIIVISDAGGCTGNICGFDEPRWFKNKSAVFSAGLRDMDAILGRDDKLVEKLAAVASLRKANFAAIIGTPVPAVIATDLKAVGRMIEKKTALPTITIDTTGTNLYDKGEEEAFLKLFKTFAKEKFPIKKGRLRIIGATPLDFSSADAGEKLSSYYRKKGFSDCVTYTMGSTIDDIRTASACEKNIVVSPQGVKTAELLEKKFGTPFEIDCPITNEEFIDNLKNIKGRKILIIHQQFAANSLRGIVKKTTDADITVASWFMMDKNCREDCDFQLSHEKEFADAVENGGYDTVIADNIFKRAIRNENIELIDFPHFAVSGRIIE